MSTCAVEGLLRGPARAARIEPGKRYKSRPGNTNNVHLKKRARGALQEGLDYRTPNLIARNTTRTAATL